MPGPAFFMLDFSSLVFGRQEQGLPPSLLRPNSGAMTSALPGPISEEQARENVNAAAWSKRFAANFIEPGLVLYKAQKPGESDEWVLLEDDALERMAKVDTVVFDKTGTLTERIATVGSVVAIDGVSTDEALALAAGVERESDHPIAAAIVSAAATQTVAADVEVVIGHGVRGHVGDHLIEVGKPAAAESLPDELRAGARRASEAGETIVVVRQDAEIIGLITITTALRPEATTAVAHLRAMGLTSAILSGDSREAVHAAASALGIEDARGGLSPEAKLDAIDTLGASGHRTMMVGDGVNDAPALSRADVGCAIGSGSQAALATSDVALLGNDLRGVPAAIGVAGSTYAIILQNFGWAIGYNLSAMPLAAFGLLDPLVAALAMGVSSVLVVLNSLRLTRLGRKGPDSVTSSLAGRGRMSLVLSVALPVVLFAGLTLVTQEISPAKGQSLLPDLPPITTTADVPWRAPAGNT